jgi:fumarate reductase subunit D
MEDKKLLQQRLLVETRFWLQDLMFRIAGCSIFETREANVMFVFSIICFYLNFVAIIMDTYMNIHNMERAMEDIRLLFPIASGFCIHLFMR